MTLTKQIKEYKMNRVIKDIQAQIALIDGNEDVVKNLLNEVLILKNMKDKYDNDRKELHKELYGYVSDTKIKEVFKKEFKACRSDKSIADLYNKYIPYIWFNRMLNTSLSKHSDLRKIITEADTKKSDHALKEVFSLGQKDMDIYKFRQSKTDVRVTKQRENNTVESDFKIKDIENMVVKIKDLVDNFDERLEQKIISKSSSAKVNIIKAYYISFLLALTTGRRQVELLKDFQIVTKRGKIEFHGLAKKNYMEDGKEILEGTINFISVKEAQKYLKMLRKELPVGDLSNEKINKKYNAMFNKAFRDRIVNVLEMNIKSDKKPLFNNSLDANEKLKAPNFHKMRSAYALTVYKMECENKKDKNIDRIEVMAKALNQVYRKNNSEYYDKAL